LYKLVDFNIAIETFDSNTTKHIKELSKLTGISVRDLHLDFKALHHACVAAVIFLDCSAPSVWKVGPAQRIASAICLHHSTRNTLVNYDKENPLPLLLTLGDELQDWGRPTSYPIGYPLRRLPQGLRIAMPKLEVSTSEYSTDCILRYKSVNFPYCDAISSKYHNLKRLRFEGAFPKITLHFPFDRVTSPITLDSIFRSFFETITFKKRGTWTFHQHHWKDSSIASFVGLKSDDVYTIRRIRMLLSSMKKSGWQSKWKLWQYQKSGNFLISMTKPIGMKIVEKNYEYRLNLQEGQSAYKSGSIIKLNDPIHTNIPPILRTVPVIVNVLTYILRREERFKRMNPKYTTPSFPLEFEDPEADIFWFKPS